MASESIVFTRAKTTQQQLLDYNSEPLAPYTILDSIRDYKEENGYYMYSKLKVPGVLIETGFISNSNDNYMIRQNNYQDIRRDYT